MKANTKVGILICFFVLVLVGYVLFDFNFDGNAIRDFESKNLSNFVDCLNEKNVVLYGTKDMVSSQLGFFGEYAEKVNFVDCVENKARCYSIFIYPSWKVNEQIIAGGLSLGMLSDISGCSLE